MTPYDRQQLREELYREEQIINLAIMALPWLFLYGMLLVSLFLEFYSKHILPDSLMYDRSYHAARFTNHMESIFIFLNVVTFLFPQPRSMGFYKGKEDWSTIEDWSFSADKIASLIGLILFSVLYYWIGFSYIKDPQIKQQYTIIFMVICVSLGVIGRILIKFLLKRKIDRELVLNHRAQIILRGIEIGGILITLACIPLFHVLFPL